MTDGLLTLLDPVGQPLPGVELPWSDGELLDLHRSFLLLAALDSFGLRLQHRGLLSAFVPSADLEAHLLGALAALGDDDWFFGDLATAPAPLIRGLDLRSWMAQLLGVARSGHLGHGAAGEMTDAGRRIYSVSSPLGSQLLPAVGAAIGARLRGGGVTLAAFGPAAAASGDFAVALDLAREQRAPVIFHLRQPVRDVLDARALATAHGLACAWVDGADVAAVHAAVSGAAARARAGEGPTLVVSKLGTPGEARNRLDGLLVARDLEPQPSVTEQADALVARLQGITDELLAEPRAGVREVFAQVFAQPTPALRDQQREAARRRVPLEV